MSEHALPTVDGPAADLGVATRFHFHVVRAPAKLNADVQTAIHESVASAESKFMERAYDADDEAPYGDDAYGGDDAYDDEANDANDANDDNDDPLASGSSDSLALVPHELVDSLVALDHRRSSAPFTIYLLNPSPPPNGERYAYSYDAAAEGGGAGGAGGGGGGGGVGRAGKKTRGSPGCPGQAWFGDEHRAWIDLTADPPRADLVDDPSEDGGVHGGGSSSDDDDDALFSSDGSVFSGDAFDAFGSLAGPRASLGAPPTPRITRANSARRRGEATPPVAPALASLIRRVAAGALAPPRRTRARATGTTSRWRSFASRTSPTVLRRGRRRRRGRRGESEEVEEESVSDQSASDRPRRRSRRRIGCFAASSDASRAHADRHRHRGERRGVSELRRRCTARRASPPPSGRTRV